HQAHNVHTTSHEHHVRRSGRRLLPRSDPSRADGRQPPRAHGLSRAAARHRRSLPRQRRLPRRPRHHLHPRLQRGPGRTRRPQLSVVYPDVANHLSERIAGALTAYACGDALGLPWENEPKAASAADIEQLPAREGWPRGSTTDDTALTLLAARHLAERGGGCDAGAFLAELAAQEPGIRGLGPTTKAAIEHFRRTG